MTTSSSAARAPSRPRSTSSSTPSARGASCSSRGSTTTSATTAELRGAPAAIGVFEAKADELRREVETRLYAESLIPDHRGDVLGLLENLDNVIDQAKQTLGQFEVERPEIPEDLAPDYVALAKAGLAGDAAPRRLVPRLLPRHHGGADHIHKVYFFEKEADRLADSPEAEDLREGLELARKIHLRYFCLHVETVSDRAEEVADRLAIYTIKRTI